MEDLNILVINPGSTSTKIAVYQNEKMLFEETIRHPKEDLAKFNKIIEQKDFRFQEIIRVLSSNDMAIENIDAIAARGGLIKAIESGVYEITEAMVEDLHSDYASLHASCLSGLIGYDLKNKYGIPAYVVDPVIVDELQDVARLSGIPGLDRVSVFHALNQKAIGERCAETLDKKYEDCNFIIAHMGGGITVAAHNKGKCIDVNNGIEGEGPFSPERCGGVSVIQVVNLCLSKKYSEKELREFATKSGGMVGYLQTNDLRECQKMIAAGDQKALLVFRTMAYQVAKEIGAMAVVLKGEIDEIILTGGLAYSQEFVEEIGKQVNFLAPIRVYPGEFELDALADNVLKVMRNEKKAKQY